MYNETGGLVNQTVKCMLKMKTIIATDIFSIGEHTEKPYKELRGACKSIEIISPYSGNKMDFTNEDEAYEYFSNKYRHAYFSSLVSKAILNTLEQIFLIGFIAGASAMRHAISTNKYPTPIKFYGFYPSQIRNYLGLSLSCESTILFPCSEKDFDVLIVSEKVSKKQNVECEVTCLPHDFMNPQSINYCPEAEKTFNRVRTGI